MQLTSIGAKIYFLPVKTRVPLKFGPETLESVTCARVCLSAEGENGAQAEGWGETPLNVQWVWPSEITYHERHDALKKFTLQLAQSWADFSVSGDVLEVGHAFQENELTRLHQSYNQKERSGTEPMPWLAALVCCSTFDIALHDAWGKLLDKPVYDTYTGEFLNQDLSFYLDEDDTITFQEHYPCDFFLKHETPKIPAWHLVGGLDPISPDELTGDEPDDGYPVLLQDWIDKDGLNSLKIKLRGNDSEWDLDRLIRIGTICIEKNVVHLTADFNCTVKDPEYVNQILDALSSDHFEIYNRILYVEQPFPYDLEKFPIDVHSISQHKPLFLDESAHNWKLIRMGKQLGWTGVALKTCKTQTGALLSLCWAKAHAMQLMVQDLTNPMLAQIPHVQLAIHAGTIMGVETNAMQFYPEASNAEAKVHPGLYTRENGTVDGSTIQGPGFGYRLEEIQRELPEPALVASRK
jgi:L-alanine-DL-glutamate epimerase-like enolase superfamily enzyme